jgi:hypothetical protein
MGTYTKEEVEELLEKQRSLCYRNARIEEFEYVNPYSESDGQITKRISKDSIMNAKLELR